MEGRIITDTTDFFSIDHGDTIQIGEKSYRVTGHERELRFGMEEPKFWVKKAVDIDTGEKKIIKLSFLETFETHFGNAKVTCFRNPEKEAKVLELVDGHPYFMQGEAFKDKKGNIIRILDIVHGRNFLQYMHYLDVDYNVFFSKLLPDILKKIVKAFEAIRFLHHREFRHGDIRNDHLIVEKDTGNYVWIDFDYDYQTRENPFGLDVFGMGNILINAVGKGFHTIEVIRNDPVTYGNVQRDLNREDFSILDRVRFINLRKLFPEIPKPLNDILMHFSIGSNVYYESAEEIIEDLNRCLYTVY
ncbi:MAG: protein kinase [Thermodesulfobacteriota bacterium]|nr:protein kinase [Thermodesulfobacteriota bacterium]